MTLSVDPCWDQLKISCILKKTPYKKIIVVKGNVWYKV